MAQERRARMARRVAAQASAAQQRRATAERELESERAAAVAVLKKAQASFERDLLDELLGPLFRGYADFGSSARERTAKERLQMLHAFKLDRSAAWVRQARTAFEKFANTVAQKWTQLRDHLGVLHGQTGSRDFWRQWSAPKLNKLIAEKLGVFKVGQYRFCDLERQQPSSRTHGRCKRQEGVMLLPEPRVFAPSNETLCTYAHAKFKPELGDTLQCDTLLLSDTDERARARTRLTRTLGSVHAFLAHTCPSVENMTQSLVRLFEQRLLDSVARLHALREDLHVELLQLEQNRAAAVHQAANEMASSFTPKWPVLSDTATGQEIDAFVDTVTTMAETSASTIAAEARQRAQQLWEQTMASKEAIELPGLDSTEIENLLLLLKPEVVETDESLSCASAQLQSISLAKAATDETAAFNFFMLRPALHDFVDSSDSLFALASPLKALALICLRLEEGVVLPLDFSRFDRQAAVFADALQAAAAVKLTSAENIASFAKSQKRTRVRDAVIVPTSREGVSMLCSAGQSQSPFFDVYCSQQRYNSVERVRENYMHIASALIWLAKPENADRMAEWSTDLQEVLREFRLIHWPTDAAPLSELPVHEVVPEMLRSVTLTWRLQLPLLLSIETWLLRCAQAQRLQLSESILDAASQLARWYASHDPLLDVPLDRMLSSISSLPPTMVSWSIDDNDDDIRLLAIEPPT
ncbi:MAG: hypothetical protein MHM6MM_006797 [Cercozoa sp. M6MM]